MALTELQLPTKQSFYQNIQTAASEMDNTMNRWRNMVEFLAVMDTADLDAMGIPAGQVRTDLVDFRVAANNIIQLYDGQSVAPPKVPSSIMDRIRRLF